MAEGQTYNIPEGGLDWFKKQIGKLGKRSAKLTGEKIYMTVIGYHMEPGTDPKFKNKIYEVFVAMPEIKLNGWEFIARIDHANEVGNIVRVMPGKVLPDEYRATEPVCNHCGHKRRRRDTFVVHHTETDQFTQVGSSCLKDFMGHGDAEKWAKLAEFHALVGDYVRYSSSYSGDLVDNRWMDTEDFVGHAMECVLRWGWVSRKTAREQDKEATADEAFRAMREHTFVSEQAAKLAGDAIEWAQSLKGGDEYEHNCYVVGSSAVMEPRSAGIAASIAGVYYNKFVRPRSTVDFTASVHQGTIGQKIEREVTVTGAFPGEFSIRNVMHDDAGNLYIWFASGQSLAQYKGQKIKIRGTVKAHNEYKGVKQTLVNRVKVI